MGYAEDRDEFAEMDRRDERVRRVADEAEEKRATAERQKSNKIADDARRFTKQCKQQRELYKKRQEGMVQAAAKWAAGDTVQQETVDKPEHYQIKINGHDIQVIDIIEAYELNFSLGNSLKYLLRAGRKYSLKEAEDLKKAAWYLTREAERIEERVVQANPRGCVG